MERSILLCYVLRIMFVLMQNIEKVFSKHYFHPYPHDLHIGGVQVELMENRTDFNITLSSVFPRNESDLKSTASPVTVRPLSGHSTSIVTNNISKYDDKGKLGENIH